MVPVFQTWVELPPAGSCSLQPCTRHSQFGYSLTIASGLFCALHVSVPPQLQQICFPP